MADKPSCLDAAYERRALEQGWRFTPVFPENVAWLKEERERQGIVKNERQSQTVRTSTEG